MSAVSDIALIALFILIGGTFAAAEMALVTFRESQIRRLPSKGKRGREIERLTSNPNRFLSAVQIGVTLSGFLSAAFGGATLAEGLSPVFMGWGIPASVAQPLALVVITVVISYFSIVIGELSAKRLAMQRAEGFALALAPLVAGIASLARPVIWFLGVSTDAVVRVFGGDPKMSKDSVSDEELREMVSGSTTLGQEERSIVDEVFAAGQLSFREVMVPRTEVDFLPSDMPIQLAYKEVRGAPHSRYPVMEGSVDKVIGFCHVRDLMDLDAGERGGQLSSIVRPVLSLPDTVKLLRALSAMRAAKAHMAIVRDEYGGTAGIVTLEDLVEQLIGDITDEYDVVDGGPPAKIDPLARLDGLMTIEEFSGLSGYVIPEGPYDTVAGYVMAQLGRLPEVGDEVTVELSQQEVSEDDTAAPSWTFTVEEMDGRRASRISARPAQEAAHG